MDRSLDEILASSNRRNGGGRSRGGQGRGDQQRRREPRNDYPRDGVRKSYRDDAPRNIDTEWVHDRFEDNGHRARQGRRGQDRDYPADDVEEVGTKVLVKNVHYDLTKEDLEGLFGGVGPVLDLDMKYDRAGRPTGSVFVTFEFFEDAQAAVKDFNGANAKGQPIDLKVLPRLRRREPNNGAGRPLSERATLPSSRNRSRSPVRDLEDEAARRNIDRYVPGSDRRDRERSPIRGRGRERGRRPGTGRERGGRGNKEGGNNREGGERLGRNGRPKKTQEELDAEMEDYFNAQAANGSGGAAASTAAPVAEEDIDMIE